MKKLGNVGILGDSYSAYEGYNENGRYYYGPSRQYLNGIDNVKKMWWSIVMDNTKSTLLTNSSYSGSCVCYTSYGGLILVDGSFIERMKKDLSFKQYDTIFLFGGTNDSWANSPIGKIIYDSWTEESLKSFLPAVSYMLDYLKKSQPNSRLIYIINSDLKKEIVDGIIEACKHYDVEYILLSNVEKENGHPNVLGMKTIANEVLDFIEKNF